MMDLGRICAVTFADAAGSFFVGLMLGALLLWLIQQKESKRP